MARSTRRRQIHSARKLVEEHSAYIRELESSITPPLHNRLQALATAVQQPGPRIVVFNPLPWKRTGLVSVPLNGLDFSAVAPADGGGASVVERHGADGAFVARDIPSLGYRTFIPVKSEHSISHPESDARSTSFESPFFKATLDVSRGGIRSLIAKSSGRELVDAAASEAMGQYLYERFASNQVQAFVKAYVKISADWATNELGKPNLPPSSDVPYQALSPTNFQVLIRETPIGMTAEMHAAAQGSLPAVTTQVTLYRDLPCADLEITLHNKAPDSWPEAGWLCLPLNVSNPQFHLGRLGSIIDPTHDIVPGSNRHLLALNTGLCVTDLAGTGVGLCALDNPLVSLDQPGCWKFSRDFVPKRPRVYVNLFNNQWTTNFRLWNGGTWTARVRLWAVDAYDNASALLTPSIEARSPLLGWAADGPPGRLPLSQSGVEISRSGVLVGALVPNPDGRGTVLRLWEQSGRSGDCQVRLPAGMDAVRAEPIDLRGSSIGLPIPIVDRAFQVNLRAFAPLSVRLLTSGE